ncbi:MAG: aminotransferase class V-fold PLP-dependent enzyme [Pseudomonadota bacterium]
MDPNLEREFPLDSNTHYLNHAAVAPWPRRTSEAVSAFAAENSEYGARYYPRWLEREEQLRQQLAWLINAPHGDDIALMKNTSEALSAVAFGLPWQRGDNVVYPVREFPSNRVVWQALAQFGVEARPVDIDRGEDPEACLIEAMDDNTRLLSTSSVQYADGLTMDLPRLSQACRQRGALFCVDAIQSIGAVPFDVQAAGADFAMADGHKWMLGPEGLAVFYVRPECREQLQLTQYGWHTLENPGDFHQSEWKPADSARRFECGSPNMLGIHALGASLTLFEEIGLKRIHRDLKANVENLRQRLTSIPDVTIHSRADRASGILNFSHPGVDPQALYRELMARGVICAQRGAGVRFSPHFYTREETLEQAVDIVKALVAS